MCRRWDGMCWVCVRPSEWDVISQCHRCYSNSTGINNIHLWNIWAVAFVSGHRTFAQRLRYKTNRCLSGCLERACCVLFFLLSCIVLEVYGFVRLYVDRLLFWNGISRDMLSCPACCVEAAALSGNSRTHVGQMVLLVVWSRSVMILCPSTCY